MEDLFYRVTKHKIESTTYDGIEVTRPCRTSEDRLFHFRKGNILNEMYCRQIVSFC